MRTITTEGAKPVYDVAFDDGEHYEGISAENVTPWTRSAAAARAPVSTMVPSSIETAKTVTYTAPDGRTFTNRRAYRKHLKDVVFSFSNRRGEVLHRGRGGVKISGQNMTLKNIEHVSQFYNVLLPYTPRHLFALISPLLRCAQ